MDNKENICPLMEAAGPLEASSSGSSAAFKPSSQAALGTKGPRAPLKDITHLYSTEEDATTMGRSTSDPTLNLQAQQTLWKMGRSGSGALLTGAKGSGARTAAAGSSNGTSRLAARMR